MLKSSSPKTVIRAYKIVRGSTVIHRSLIDHWGSVISVCDGELSGVIYPWETLIVLPNEVPMFDKVYPYEKSAWLNPTWGWLHMGDIAKSRGGAL